MDGVCFSDNSSQDFISLEDLQFGTSFASAGAAPISSYFTTTGEDKATAVIP